MQLTVAGRAGHAHCRGWKTPSAQFRLVQTGNTFEGIEPEPANCGVVTHLSLEQPLTLPVLVIAPPPATPTTAQVPQ